MAFAIERANQRDDFLMRIELNNMRGRVSHVSLRERFEMSYMPVTESGCWIWIAKINHQGYGGLIQAGSRIAAHRLSWQMHRGPIPDDLNVCHACDVRPCVNPNHLFLGTQKQNINDMVSKRRHAKQIITRADADTIRAATDEDVHVLAQRFGVCAGVIYNVRARRSFQ